MRLCFGTLVISCLSRKHSAVANILGKANGVSRAKRKKNPASVTSIGWKDELVAPCRMYHVTIMDQQGFDCRRLGVTCINE